MIPSFGYLGGKVRIRDWLLSKFPLKGEIYFEPFAGLGNVYYLSQSILLYNNWILNDTNPFLKILKDIDISELNSLPKEITKELYDYYKSSGCNISKLIEYQITYANAGYKTTYNPISITGNRYTRSLYLNKLKLAKNQLSKATIHNQSWETFNYNSFNEQSFLYFDPPYINTHASYGNIKHTKLIDILNKAKFKWALSGYDNDFYKQCLNYNNKYELVINKNIDSSTYKETLWTNYA